MLARRKPIEAEATEYAPGMHDGILAQCTGRHTERVFDSEQHMEEQQDVAGFEVRSWTWMILDANNKPVPVEKGDYLIDGVVWKKKDFDKEWEVFKKPGPGRKPGYSPKKAADAKK